MGRTTNEEERPKQHSHSSHEHPMERNISGQGINITCSGCNLSIAAGREYYTCRACSYSLHRVCFNMPSSCQHQAEPGHDLILLLVPSFQCKACGVQGSGFCYNCNICDTEYHSLCLKRPATEKCALHDHDLELTFFPPYQDSQGFKCDVCLAPGSNQWLYRCNRCDFDVHLNCVYAAPSPQSQPRNLPHLPSQAPLVSPNNYNFNMAGSSTTSSSVSPTTTYLNHGHFMQTSGNQMSPFQSQNPPALSTRSVPISTTGISMTGQSVGALPSNATPTYAIPYTAPTYGNHGNQMGAYGYNPVVPAQTGFMDMGAPPNVGYGIRNSNQPAGPNNSQGIFGAGALGVVLSGVLTGVGEGIGQGLVQNAFDGFGSDGTDGSVI